MNFIYGFEKWLWIFRKISQSQDRFCFPWTNIFKMVGNIIQCKKINFAHPIVFWIQICRIRQGYLLNSTENLANSSGCDKFDRSVEFVVFPNWNTVSRNNNKMKKTGLEKKILMITLAHLQSIPKRFGNRPFSWLWDSNLLIYLKI